MRTAAAGGAQDSHARAINALHTLHACQRADEATTTNSSCPTHPWQGKFQEAQGKARSTAEDVAGTAKVIKLNS